MNTLGVVDGVRPAGRHGPARPWAGGVALAVAGWRRGSGREGGPLFARNLRADGAQGEGEAEKTRPQKWPPSGMWTGAADMGIPKPQV